MIFPGLAQDLIGLGQEAIAGTGPKRFTPSPSGGRIPPGPAIVIEPRSATCLAPTVTSSHNGARAEQADQYP
jgi:hypothetical protein